MQVLNLLITAVGRDLLSLIGLAAVMVIQDPVMSLSAVVIAPPAMWMIRKLVRRVRAVAKAQFTGGTRLFETMQETVQGIRIVKAFTLEDRMRKRYYDNVAAVEYEANKMARVSNRSSPMMEALAGVAIAMGVIYGGYRTIEMSATPGEFFSFITAFLLAYEPAKRLARLNIELNAGLIGVRQLFEIIDAPSSEPADDSKPKLVIDKARVEFKDVRFSYRENEPVLRGLSLVAEAGQMTALVGPSGGGKSTILNYHPASLRAAIGRHPDRRAGHRECVAAFAAPADRLCRPGRVPVPRHDPRQYRLRQGRRDRRRDRGRGQGRQRA